MKNITISYCSVLTLLLLNLGCAWAQSSILSQGKITNENVTYDVRINQKSRYMYIINSRNFNTIANLEKTNLNKEVLPEEFLEINRDDLISIKRKMLGVEIEILTTLYFTTRGNFIDVSYRLSKDSEIYKANFKDFDRKLRASVRGNVRFPKERLGDYMPYMTRTIILK